MMTMMFVFAYRVMGSESAAVDKAADALQRIVDGETFIDILKQLKHDAKMNNNIISTTTVMRYSLLISLLDDDGDDDDDNVDDDDDDDSEEYYDDIYHLFHG